MFLHIHLTVKKSIDHILHSYILGKVILFSWVLDIWRWFRRIPHIAYGKLLSLLGVWFHAADSCSMSNQFIWVHVLLWYVTALQRSLKCGYEKDYLLASLKIVIILDFLCSHAVHKNTRCFSVAVEFASLSTVSA